MTRARDVANVLSTATALATDTETAAAISSHNSANDPHPGYLLESLFDAKGDLVVGTAADAFSRLGVGATNGMVLTVDSAEATGLKYATPASGGAQLSDVFMLMGA